MKISALITELKSIQDRFGDLPMTISCDNPMSPTDQKYIVSEDFHVVIEDYAEPDRKEVMLRDWLY
jgi:hypothetical protein